MTRGDWAGVLLILLGFGAVIVTVLLGMAWARI